MPVSYRHSGESRNPELPSPGDSPVAGTVAIETHGCKLNQADSAVLARQFSQAGYRLVDSKADADIIVVNTCTVTSTADSKARQALRAARRANPEAIVVAAGCYPQRAADELRLMPEVSVVVGNSEKPKLAELAIAESTRRNGSSTPSPSPSPLMGEGRGEGVGILRRSRAMVKIQEGCDQVCAYCIVPKVRGRERSIPPDELVSNVRHHVAAGFKEVTLTGTQLGTYGFDLEGTNLVRLLADILEGTALSRLRVSSLQAHEIRPELLELWRDPRLCPHFHVPLQSGCDTTLKAMRRRYDTATFRRAVELIRENIPNVSITTDVIVGFPGEDAHAHAESLAFASDMRFADIHVFPYSPRPGTSAYYFANQVQPEEKRRRATEMNSMASKAFGRYRSRILGQSRPVLWETAHYEYEHGAMRWSGLTDNYLRVNTFTTRDLNNLITGARLLRLDGKYVVATISD